MDRPNSAEPMVSFPLALLAATFALGITVPKWVAVGRWPAITFGLFISALAVAFRKRLRLATLLLAVAFVPAGYALVILENDLPRHDSVTGLLDRNAITVGAPVEITGTLLRDPELARDRVYIDLQVEQVRQNGRDRASSGVVAILLSASPNTPIFKQLELRYGARIRVMTRLDRADRYRNPGVSQFSEYLELHGYDASAFVKSVLLIERLDDARVIAPLAWIYRARAWMQTEFDSRFSPSTAGVLDAALLGNRYNLSQSASERFRVGGTFHVLVISGLHITFLGAIVFFIVSRATRNKLVQFLCSALIVWGYSLAVGAETSVVRAALMFSAALIAPLLARKTSSLNLLGGVALVLLAWRPTDLFDPSFQLTFVSVLAIVGIAWPLLQRMQQVGAWRPMRETPYPPVCAPWFKTFCEALFWSDRKGSMELAQANYIYRLFKSPSARTLERLHLQRPVRYMFAAVLVSVSVQLALAPFLVLYFHRLSIASIFLNIVVNVLMAAVLIGAMAATAIAQFSTAAAAPLFWLTESMNWLMIHAVDPFSTIGAASIRVPEYSGRLFIVYALYYIPLLLLTTVVWRWQPLELPQKGSKPRRKRSVMIGTCAQCIALFVMITHPGSAAAMAGRLRVDFVDVDQGDCALITTPAGTTILIDGGGKPGPFKNDLLDDEESNRETRSIGESVVSEYLWWRGLKQVDYVVITHADADHIDGVNDVMRNFNVRAALVARSPNDDREFAKFLNTASQQSVPVRQIAASDELEVDGVHVKILWPYPSRYLNAPSRNDDSIVLALSYGSRAFLFTGDIENRAEENLVNGGQSLHADVVKVAHHGSMSSSSNRFVNSVSPVIAVISVGQTSIFGHPHPDVVERWKAIGAQVLTTGNSGTITITTNGHDLEVETFVK